MTWQEVTRGITPENFTIEKIPTRLKEKGDFFVPLRQEGTQSLDEVLEFIGRQWLN